MKDTEKLKAFIFSVVFAVVCGIGVSIAVYFAEVNKPPETAETGAVFNEPKIKVHVKGEVKNPGIYEFTTDKRVQDALDAAGGALENADPDKLNLASILKDGQTIIVASKSGGQSDSKTPDPENNTMTAQVSGKVNINTADVNQLDALPGIGPSLAERIISYRKENGNFKKIEDIINVSGIGEKKFEQFKEYICN